jgi:5'-methylthioadenosine phosphorylase
MQQSPVLGVIGGSGLYEFKGLKNPNPVDIETPFGKPSAPIMIGTIQDKPVAFLARHGIGHHLTPSEVNYRANIYALKMLGIDKVISVSACGSLRDDFVPGDIVVPDQIFDLTHKRSRSFFGDGLVCHISVAEPFCSSLSDLLLEALRLENATTHKGGAYITIEGPRFSTKAESQTYRSWGMSIIGMTASPEVFLAKEAEMCYATMAHVTDYDVWHVSEKPVTVEMVVRTLHKNTELAQNALFRLVEMLDDQAPCQCDSALKDSLITNPAIIPENTRNKLDILVRKYLD